MKRRKTGFALPVLLGMAAIAASAGAEAQTLYPRAGATGVNPDVQLRLTFDSTPAIGDSGFIRVYDAASGEIVDEIDLGLPPGPTERASGEALTAPYITTPYPYDELPTGRTNANTRPGTPTAGARPPEPGYQLSIIGGFTDGFHFYPVIVDGTTAIVQLHHNLLEYGRSYYVEIDPAVFPDTTNGFAGIAGPDAWRFDTKPAAAAPSRDARQLVVSADGSGDFDTVQGAMDFVPDRRNAPADERMTVLVRSGVYHEIVYFRNKSNVTIRGEAPDAVRVTYANGETLNPHPVNIKTNEHPGTFPSRRATFAVDNSDGIHLVNLILENSVFGQAEGLLVAGERNILSHVRVIGSGDALQANGPTYVVDSEIVGAGDTVLGRGPVFFERCTLRSQGVFMWIRNTAANHGNVFKNCTFIGTGPEPTVIARSPQNNVSTYPYAEAVLLECTLVNIAPEGFGPADSGENVHFWELASRNDDGSLVDVSRRVAWSRQLDAVADAALIRDYSDPAYVLGGWTPELEGEASVVSAGSAAVPDYAAYFFPHFVGESTAEGEAIYFAVSDGNDPTAWITLNGGAPVLTSELGTRGLRDPFIIRSAEGDRFFLLATDLMIYGGGDFGSAQEQGSRALMIWESDNLIDWSDARRVVVAPENAGNVWAPEAYWDAAAGTYLVYWASALYPDDLPPGERDIADSYQRMLLATTRDFVSFSAPEVWIDEPRGPGRGMIDSTIAEQDGVYYRLTKDESYYGMRQESSTDLHLTQGVKAGDGWRLIAERVGFGQANPWGGSFTAGEGPTMFRSNVDATWYLLQDQPSYHGGQGYVLFATDDLPAADWHSLPDAQLPASPRHGTVIPITAAEYQGLLARYGDD